MFVDSTPDKNKSLEDDINDFLNIHIKYHAATPYLLTFAKTGLERIFIEHGVVIPLTLDKQNFPYEPAIFYNEEFDIKIYLG